MNKIHKHTGNDNIHITPALIETEMKSRDLLELLIFSAYYIGFRFCFGKRNSNFAISLTIIFHDSERAKRVTAKGLALGTPVPSKRVWIRTLHNIGILFRASKGSMSIEQLPDTKAAVQWRSTKVAKARERVRNMVILYTYYVPARNEPVHYELKLLQCQPLWSSVKY